MNTLFHFEERATKRSATTDVDSQKEAKKAEMFSDAETVGEKQCEMRKRRQGMLCSFSSADCRD